MLMGRACAIVVGSLALWAALPAGAQNLTRGGALYESICQACHFSPPIGGAATAANNPSRIANAIRTQSAMFPFSFLDMGQLTDIAAYIAFVQGVSPPNPAPNYTALWWNPTESGWGINFNHQGDILFGTLFTYDANRAPLWLVMSNGVLQPDGVTYTGDLYRTTGPVFNANPFSPSAVGVTRVGSMTASFAGVNTATLRYTVNGVEVVKAIERQVFGTRAATCQPSTESRATASNYQDLWWNEAESGWGINITHQDNTLFATLFTYNASGRDLWLVMSAGVRQADGSYLGDLYQTAGPAFNTSPFTGVTVAMVGTMRLRFSDGNNGTLTYTYNGVAVSKAIARQVFSSPVPACSS